MSGASRRKERFGRRARAAVTVTAVGVAVACLGTVAFGSSAANGRQGRPQSRDLAYALAAGRDGKLAVAGVSRVGGIYQWAVARYTAAGTLDRGFGTGGKVLTGFGAQSDAGATSLAIYPEGKIVVAGYAYVRPKTDSGFAIARYTVAGKLDRTFGRNGKVLTYVGSGAHAVAIQADGKVVAVGGSRSGFALARYTRLGRLDRSFGRSGTVMTGFAHHCRGEHGRDPDGRQDRRRRCRLSCHEDRRCACPLQRQRRARSELRKGRTGRDQGRRGR